MTLPVPDLDDRTFQGLVDEAKRMVQRRCPEWTDHNVSDPGVTLIEAFAFMTDQLVYRLNRIPDRLFIKFLELIGVKLFPPTPARVKQTFWLSAPQESVMTVPGGTRVATIQTETTEAIVFATADDLDMVPCELETVAVQNNGADSARDMTRALAGSSGFACFSEVPTPGDAVLIALSSAVPNNAVQLRFKCTIQGVGVDPTNPPLVWEAYTADGWAACELERDETGGLNRDGDVVIHVPEGHTPSVIEQQLGGWVRARVIEAEEEQPKYSASPTVYALAASTIGGTVEAINAEIIEREELGTSEGVAGQRFKVARFPVLAGAGPAVVETTSDEGWQEWTPVDNFGSSGPEDRHFILDAVNGEVCFGPAVREPDGSVRHYGAVPPRGCVVRMRAYSVGGGRAGNVMSSALTVLKSSIPYVSAVTNRHPAHGGVDGETIEEAKDRGPVTLRTKDRAVTAEDFEQITKEVAPEVARVRAVPAGDEDVDSGGVRVLCVPSPRTSDPRIPLEELVINEDTTAKIKERLDQCRLIGTRVSIEAPFYQAVTVVARLVARRRASTEQVTQDALAALYSYLSPLTGGPEGTGWPWGRPVQSGEVFGTLQKVPGVELVEDVRIFGADPITGARAGQDTRRLEMPVPSALVFSFEHQVMVEPAR